MSRNCLRLRSLHRYCSVHRFGCGRTNRHSGEAKAIVGRAVATVKADKATALGEFDDKNNKQFHDRDLYVFCFNMSDGKLTADADQAVMGIDIRNLKFKGEPVGQRQYDATKAAPEGRVIIEDYDFPKPGTSESFQRNPI